MVDELIDITRALSDETRVRMLICLRDKELCVCQLVELSGLATSTASKHLSILRRAGLLEMRKQGRWVYYRLPGEDAAVAARAAVGWVVRHLAEDPKVRADVQRLEEILQIDPEELCRRQMAKSRCCSSAPATPAEARWPKDSPARSGAG